MARPSDALERPDLALLAEVRAGLLAPRRRIASKFFYDRVGSALFEEITRLPEYYLTRAEREILDAWMPALAAALRPRTLVELGAGGSTKARLMLDALRAAGPLPAYVPVDVSGAMLRREAAALRDDYPGIEVVPVVRDFTGGAPLPAAMARPALVAFLGSTIGNLHPAAATRLLAEIRAGLRDDDHLLLGADLRKDPAVLEAAYNDAAGVTAAFNRNALRVVNRRAGTDFDPEAFEHRAFWHAGHGRIEMHLVARSHQIVRLPGGESIVIERGESIRTEISCKYDRETIAALLDGAGFRLAEWRTDAGGRFALALATPA